MEFYDSKNSDFYLVTRDFKQYEYKANDGLSGEKYKKSSTGKSRNSASKEAMVKKELTELLNKFQFIYIESININIPQIVEQLTDDIIDVEYEGTRMTESKKVLKEAYQSYTNGLQNILNVFSQNITGTFNNFKSNWNISFVVPKSVDTFRDLISDDVELCIDDKGCNSVEQKGSGLQRLAVILLNFEILKRLKKKSNIIVCVDEPDIYLHEGLQKN
ncbi:MAG: AAA family ATPase [Eubacteriales bacterium]|nr:AAA family ATPase [Eubacteriales bacterium]